MIGGIRVKEDFLKDIAESIKIPTEITKAAVEPAAAQIGEGLGNLFYLVFSPLAKARIKKEHEIKLYGLAIQNEISKVPSDILIEPSLSIVGPALEASKYFIENSELREMFARLIASSMNSKQADKTHPAFVEIIKQITPDEAKILKELGVTDYPTLNLLSQNDDGSYFPVLMNFTDIQDKASCHKPTQIFSYLENLDRLGLIRIYEARQLAGETVYEDLLNHQVIVQGIVAADLLGRHKIVKTSISVTPFGKSFYESCIKN